MERALAYAIAFVLTAALLWLPLSAVLRFLPRFLDLTLPPPGEFLARTAVVAALVVALGLVPWVGWALGIAAAGLLLQRWFDADFAATAITIVLVWALHRGAVLTVVALLD